MPSAADQPDPAGMDDVLREVKTAGLQRRRSRQRRRSFGAVVSAVTLVAGFVATLPDDDQVVETDQASDETTSTRRTEVLGTLIERDAVDPATPSTSETTPPPSTTAPPPAPVAPPSPLPPPPTTLSCVQSTDPACGPFRWEPAPAANQPLTLTAEDAALTAGTTTVLLVHWDDPDAQLVWTDNDIDGAMLADPCQMERRYGPWTPPPPDGGSGTIELAYTAPAEPGTYVITVIAATGGCDGYHPYHSDATTTITVTVEQAPGET